MCSVPEGRAANQPLVETTFNPPIGALLPRARVSFAVIGSPASSVAVTASGESFFEEVLLLGRRRGVDPGVIRGTELGGQLLVMHAGIRACARGDFRREQTQDEAIFIRGPDCAVAP